MNQYELSLANCSKFFSLSILIFGELLVNPTIRSRNNDKTLIYICKDIIFEIMFPELRLFISFRNKKGYDVYVIV